MHLFHEPEPLVASITSIQQITSQLPEHDTTPPPFFKGGVFSSKGAPCIGSNLPTARALTPLPLLFFQGGGRGRCFQGGGPGGSVFQGGGEGGVFSRRGPGEVFFQGGGRGEVFFQGGGRGGVFKEGPGEVFQGGAGGGRVPLAYLTRLRPKITPFHDNLKLFMTIPSQKQPKNTLSKPFLQAETRANRDGHTWFRNHCDHKRLFSYLFLVPATAPAGSSPLFW